MYVKRVYKKRVAAKKPYKRVARKTARPSKALTKAVQQIIHKNSENKEAYHSIDTIAFNSGINSTGDPQRCLPNVAVGTAENERIGEQIRAQKLNIKGHYILTVSNNSYPNARIAVRMMVVQPKNLSGYPDASATAAWQTQLLKKGGTNVGFTGLISDLYAPINTDQITCSYDKITYVSMPYIGTTTGTTLVNTVYTHDVSKSVKFFNINLRVKNKLLKYDKNYSSVQPTSYTPMLVVGYAHMDGSSPDVLTTQVYVSFDSIFTFEDM